MSGAHAILSPSGAYRWMVCPGSVALERDEPDDSNDYADEGTAAHMLAQIAWTEGRTADAYIGRRMDLGHKTWEVTEEMAEEVQKYLNIVKALSVNGDTFVEVVVPIGHITGEEGASGTADTVVIDERQRELIGIDLKFGMGVRVFAKDNPQLLFYLLGVYDQYKLLYDFDTVRGIISQPRLDHIDEHSYTIAELEAFRKTAQTRATVAYGFKDASVEEASGQYADKPGFAFLNPGAQQCQFCKAKAKCPALAAHVQETVGADFDDISNMGEENMARAVEAFTSAEIGATMDAVELLEFFNKAVRAKVEALLLQGVPVPSPQGGYKLVKGRKGARAWVDEKDAEKLLKGFRLPSDDIYTKKLITPTAAEKLLKDAPKRWEKLNTKEVISQSDGGKSVAPMSDKRPAIETKPPTADGFDVVQEESELI